MLTCYSAASYPQVAECLENSAYNPSASSSSQVSKVGAELKYGLGDAIIRYVKDDIALPGSDVDLSGVQFGVATQSTYISHGIMGLSFGNKLNMKYNSFVDELVEQKLVDTRTIGIALGAKEEKANSGLLTFGGVDTKKFVGDLHSAPILDPQHGEAIWR